MVTLDRGIQSYLLVLSFGSLVALLWAANRYLFGHTTSETGWPLLFSIAAVVLLIGLGLRRLRSTPDSIPPSESHPWSSRDPDRRE